MTEARIVVSLLSGDVLTGLWDEYTDAKLAYITENIAEVISDETGNFKIVTDEHVSVFISCQRINFIRLETR